MKPIETGRLRRALAALILMNLYNVVFRGLCAGRIKQHVGHLICSGSVARMGELNMEENMTDTVVGARISPALKAAVMANAKAVGLDLSTVTRMAVYRLTVDAEWLRDLLHLNHKTLQSVCDLENNIEVTGVDTVDGALLNKSDSDKSPPRR